MIALLRVELTRLRWRRAVWLLTLAAIVIPAVIAVATIWNTRPPAADDLAEAERQAAQEASQPYIQDELERCLERPRRYGVDPDGDVQTLCEESVVPQADWFFYFEQLDLRSEMDFGSGFGVITVLTLLLMLAGTTFVGHDWSSGSMSNQLLFESRRGRIWSAKAIVVTAYALVTAVAVSAAYWIVLYLVARSRDLPVDRHLLLDCLQYGGRGALFAAAAALAGFALTMLFRSTVATIGILFALSVFGGILIAVAGLDGKWQPATNLEAIVKNGTTYYADVPDRCYSDPISDRPDDSECDQERELSAQWGVGYYGVLTLAAGAASVASFRRRDVP